MGAYRGRGGSGGQRRRAVAFVIMSHCPQPPRKHRQAFLAAVEGLDLALLIARQHQRMLGRAQIQAHHIDQLLGKLRIVRDFECRDQMRLQAIVTPHTTNRVLADSDSCGHRTHRPLRRIRRQLLSRSPDDLRLVHRPDCGGRSRARGILLDPDEAFAWTLVTPVQRPVVAPDLLALCELMA